MSNKRLEILHVYEKGLKNSFDLKTGAMSSTCPAIYPNNRQKVVMSIFSKTVFVVTKIFRIWTMGVITFHTHMLMSLVKFSWRLVLLNTFTVSELFTASAFLNDKILTTSHFSSLIFFCENNGFHFQITASAPVKMRTLTI